MPCVYAVYGVRSIVYSTNSCVGNVYLHNTLLEYMLHLSSGNYLR